LRLDDRLFQLALEFFLARADRFRRDVAGVDEHEAASSCAAACHRLNRYLGAALLFAITTTLVFIFDRRTHQLIGSSTKFFLSRSLLPVWRPFSRTSRAREVRCQSGIVQNPPLQLQRCELVVVSICYALTGFLMPFYLQDILRLTSTTGRHTFYGAVDLDGGTGAGERLYDRPAGTAYSGDRRRRVHDYLSGAGGMLRTDSHWLLPAMLIVVGAITNGIFNPATRRL